MNIIFHQTRLLVKMDDKGLISLPHPDDIIILRNSLTEVFINNDIYVANLFGDAPQNLINLEFISFRQALNHFDETIIYKLVYYQQLSHYYNTHKFCGTCGSLTVRQNQNKFTFCNPCNKEIYPHIAPCVIARIHKGNQILMARGVNFPPGSWGLIAGFVEIGESLEEAIKREAMEEVGIEIDNIKYWGSQAWPFPDNTLMVAFTANYKSGELKPDKLEIEDARFCSKNNTPGRPSSQFSIASKMINDFLNS